MTEGARTSGNYLEPLVAGAALSLSPFAVVFAVFFWGFLWGIPGAFIGVPILITINPKEVPGEVRGRLDHTIIRDTCGLESITWLVFGLIDIWFQLWVA